MEVQLRPMRPEDVKEVIRITSDTGFFRPDEREVAREVLEEAAAKGHASGYQVYVAAWAERLLGYVCFGPTPLTVGTWDIYWIAVDPRYQGQGLGKRLMNLAEERVSCQEGRLILVETSSQDLYHPTREFYRSMQYREVSCIPDFYEPGDAKVTFAKYVFPGENRPMPP